MKTVSITGKFRKSGPGYSKQDKDNPGLVRNLNSDMKA